MLQPLSIVLAFLTGVVHNDIGRLHVDIEDSLFFGLIVVQLLTHGSNLRVTTVNRSVVVGVSLTRGFQKCILAAPTTLLTT